MSSLTDRRAASKAKRQRRRKAHAKTQASPGYNNSRINRARRPSTQADNDEKLQLAANLLIPR